MLDASFKEQSIGLSEAAGFVERDGRPLGMRNDLGCLNVRENKRQ
jgi:hypothetical protein